MSGLPGPVELLIIFAIVLILFGYKKVPDAARSLGRSMRIFKTEVREMKAEDRSESEPVKKDDWLDPKPR